MPFPRGIALLALAILSTLPALAGKQPSLLDRFVSVDSAFADAAQVATGRAAFDSLVDRGSLCSEEPLSDRATCVVSTIFGSGELSVVAEPGDPESSTVTSVLAARRGNCAALAATVLSLADRLNVPMEAVVFPSHVVVRMPGSDQAFELLNHGFPQTLAQIRKRQGTGGAQETIVRPGDFPAYYLDNLAVRFAEAGSTDRADSMFKQAIDTGPRLARIRFNYGTFLLGRDLLQRAQEQLHRAVRLDAQNASAWANLGVAFARQQRTADARKCFERALQVDRGNRIASENLKALNAGALHQP